MSSAGIAQTFVLRYFLPALETWPLHYLVVLAGPRALHAKGKPNGMVQSTT